MNNQSFVLYWHSWLPTVLLEVLTAKSQDAEETTWTLIKPKILTLPEIVKKVFRGNVPDVISEKSWELESKRLAIMVRVRLNPLVSPEEMSPAKIGTSPMSWPL